MDLYVIRRNEDGLYVAAPNRERGYTDKLIDVRFFTSRTLAENHCCGNEYVCPLSALCYIQSRWE